jgi:hypothetical protein
MAILRGNLSARTEEKLVLVDDSLEAPLQDHRRHLVCVLELGGAGDMCSSIKKERLQREWLGVQVVARKHRHVLLLRGQQEQERRPAQSASSSPTHAVDVIRLQFVAMSGTLLYCSATLGGMSTHGFAGRVVLQDPVDAREVQSAGRHVGAQ